MDETYNFDDFVSEALCLPEDHVNLGLINRIIDLIDTLSKVETRAPHMWTDKPNGPK